MWILDHKPVLETYTPTPLRSVQHLVDHYQVVVGVGHGILASGLVKELWVIRWSEESDL